MSSYANYEDFYDANEPDDAAQLADLYRSVTEVSSETFFTTEETRSQKARYKVIASGGDKLYLTAKSHRAFIRFIETKNDDPDLDIETAAQFRYDMDNPHS